MRVLAKLLGVQQEDIGTGVSELKVAISIERGETEYYNRVQLPILVGSQIQGLYYRNRVLSFFLYRRK